MQQYDYPRTRVITRVADDDERLRPARAVMVAVVLAVPLWAAIAVAVHGIAMLVR